MLRFASRRLSSVACGLRRRAHASTQSLSPPRAGAARRRPLAGLPVVGPWLVPLLAPLTTPADERPSSSSAAASKQQQRTPSPSPEPAAYRNGNGATPPPQQQQQQESALPWPLSQLLAPLSTDQLEVRVSPRCLSASRVGCGGQEGGFCPMCSAARHAAQPWRLRRCVVSRGVRPLIRCCLARVAHPTSPHRTGRASLSHAACPLPPCCLARVAHPTAPHSTGRWWDRRASSSPRCRSWRPRRTGSRCAQQFLVRFRALTGTPRRLSSSTQPGRCPACARTVALATWAGRVQGVVRRSEGAAAVLGRLMAQVRCPCRALLEGGRPPAAGAGADGAGGGQAAGRGRGRCGTGAAAGRRGAGAPGAPPEQDPAPLA